MTADDLDTPSPSLKHRLGRGHERTSSSVSRTMSDAEGDTSTPAEESPAPWRGGGRHSRDSDWAFARREAANAILGSDQKMSNLTDDELDVLYDDLQRVRATRKARPESRILDFSSFGSNGVASGDVTDSESVTSHRVREKYLSNGTLDNFSLDTALTLPSTPQLVSDEEGEQQQLGVQEQKDAQSAQLGIAKEDMQEQLEMQKLEFQQQLQADEAGTMEIEEMRAEKLKMEASLAEMKEQMESQLREQKEAFEEQLAALKSPSRPTSNRKSLTYSSKPSALPGGLTDRDIFLAKHVLQHWRAQRSISIAASILRNASLLKEAQILSQQMGQNIVFQHTIVDEGHTVSSTYDLVINGVSAEEGEDLHLEEARKPCAGIRVIDFSRCVVRLWSVEKLQTRVRAMRKLAAYRDRPEYLQHFRLEDPFADSCMPEYSRIGDAAIPLAAVFECRVQDFTLEIHSPFTQSVVGIIRLSLEPSSAEAPRETLKFNVVMHELLGFAEREGTEVHAQLFVPGVSEEVGGATTTTLIEGFGEGGVRFGSVHGLSLPLDSPPEASLRVSVFARVTAMHLDKLLSWDDMRDASSSSMVTAGVRPKAPRRLGSRLPESAFVREERHDVFASVQVLEIDEEGKYEAVEVVQRDTLDQGSYQLHQGLQRRVVVTLTSCAGAALPWSSVGSLKAGTVRLVGEDGLVQDADAAQSDVLLPLLSPALIRTLGDGSTLVKMTGQWDSSAHGSLLLDRPTGERYRVQLSLSWEVTSARTTQPMHFSFDLALQTRPRTWFRQNSLLSQLWHNQRVVHSTAQTFAITLKPGVVKRAGDLWKLDTMHVPVAGEEVLDGWAPRGLSLVRDFLEHRKRLRRVAELEAARGWLSLDALSSPARAVVAEGDEYSDRQKDLLTRMLELWQTTPSASELMLLRSQNATPDLEPNGTLSQSTRLSATVDPHTKHPTILKSGWLLSPSTTPLTTTNDTTEPSPRWIRRYAELRKPYMHLYSTAGDEIIAINLTNSRIDREPQVAKLLRRPEGRMAVWAIYATGQAWLFGVRDERERGEWIWGVDRCFGGEGEVLGVEGMEVYEDDEV
ncbi:hypothetical protein LTR62_005022 [Meristemomyces frigidus]|uniref:PH domain-containing protein n=1 Tax=Meristemomyces frigidus TaxID=1508187 RepID=A0AAN7YJD3_9PEZI|nr:hypothetical protein LTR62_005022 [Meristemomyces frigidus]